MDRAKWCIHFNGCTFNDKCKADVEYRAVRLIMPGNPNAVYPCFHHPYTFCDKYESHEQVKLEAQEKEREAENNTLRSALENLISVAVEVRPINTEKFMLYLQEQIHDAIRALGLNPEEVRFILTGDGHAVAHQHIQEDREGMCPAWYRQVASHPYEPEWEECRCCVGVAFSACKYFEAKSICWARWDLELKEKAKVAE